MASLPHLLPENLRKLLVGFWTLTLAGPLPPSQPLPGTSPHLGMLALDLTAGRLGEMSSYRHEVRQTVIVSLGAAHHPWFYGPCSRPPPST